ncbi:hypothetical protein BKI49_20515 [Streptomyces sp. Tue6028]|nr:hypothetical protein BKI49_20515 [Streptomyces sp. Tue6028]
MQYGTQYRTGVRRAALAMVTVSAAALFMTACQPGDDGVGSGSSPSHRPAEPAASSGAPSTGTSTPPSGKASPGGAGSPSAPSTPAAAKACGVSDLEASMRQAEDRPDGTGTGAAVVQFTNTSAGPCTVQGHPTVAGAGNGSPDKNHPLAVTSSGAASKVLLAPGGKAWTKLTFVQVQGEADGYCESGSTPVTYPTLVVGLPGAGSHQVALDDGVLAECDDTVTVTAVSATEPS